jgi:hypothetical protein
MSLLRMLLAIKPVRTPLEFGINENVRLVAMDNEVRKWENEVINRNTFLTFAKFNDEGTKIESSEFSYFNLDHTSDFVFANLVQQVGQLNNLANLLNPGSEVDPTEEFEDLEEIKEALRTKKGCQAMMDIMWKQFSEAVEGKTGAESPLLRIKVAVSGKGGWLQLPQDAHFAESMEYESTLGVTAYELNQSSEPKQETADEKGDAPDEKPKKKSALSGL